MNQALTAQQLREWLQCERCNRYFPELVSVRIELGVGRHNTMPGTADMCEDCADCSSADAGVWLDGDCVADAFAVYE